MKRLIAILAIAVCLTVPAWAEIGEAELSGSYTDQEGAGKSASVQGGVYAPLGKRFLLGPSGRFSYLSPENGGSLTGSAAGAVLEYHVTGNEKGVIPFLRAEGLYWFGDLADYLDYQYSAGGGLKVGDDATALKFTVVRTWVQGTDLEATEASIGFVLRL